MHSDAAPDDHVQASSHQLEKALPVHGAGVARISPTVLELVAGVAGSAVDGALRPGSTSLAGRQRPIVLIDDLQRHVRQNAADRLLVQDTPRRRPVYGPKGPLQAHHILLGDD